MTRSAGSLCMPGKVDATDRGIFRAWDGRPVDSTRQPAVYYVPRIRDFVQDEQEAKAHISFALNPERRCILMTFVAMPCNVIDISRQALCRFHGIVSFSWHCLIFMALSIFPDYFKIIQVAHTIPARNHYYQGCLGNVIL